MATSPKGKNLVAATVLVAISSPAAISAQRNDENLQNFSLCYKDSKIIISIYGPCETNNNCK